MYLYVTSLYSLNTITSLFHEDNFQMNKNNVCITANREPKELSVDLK